MREIKFRGRHLSGQWYYGNLIRKQTEYIVGDIEDGSAEDVEEETVGQFTGLYDKNGKEIYEGDIVLYREDIKFVVKYHHGGFGYTIELGDFLLGGNSNFSFNPNDKDYKFEVIGNIYDNPELLEGDEKTMEGK